MPEQHDPWRKFEKSPRSERGPEKKAPIEKPKPAPKPASRSFELMSAEELQRGKDKVSVIRRKVQEDRYGSLFNERARLPPDSAARKALSPAESGFLKTVVDNAAKENSKISTAILKEGIAISAQSSGKIFEAGQKSIVDKLLRPDSDFYLQAVTLLNGQKDRKLALEALVNALEKKVKDIVTLEEQKRTVAKKTAEKKRAESTERLKEQEEKEKPGFWDKIRGR